MLSLKEKIFYNYWGLNSLRVKICVLSCLVCCSSQVIASDDLPEPPAYNDHTDFDQYSVYYSVFNSTFIPAHVAANYGIKRSKYESLINVSISPKGKYGALPGKVSGTVKNLMQQQKVLKFIEIAEKDATYYIAAIRVSGQDDLHFELVVTPDGETKPLTMKFVKRLYSD